MRGNLILERPILTEKLNSLGEKGIYSFVVNPKATKHEIKRALEKKYSVVIGAVRVMNVRGKKIRIVGKRFYTQKKTWKKAYVRVLSGTIEVGK